MSSIKRIKRALKEAYDRNGIPINSNAIERAKKTYMMLPHNKKHLFITLIKKI